MRVLVRHVILPQAEHIALLEITFSTPGLHVCCVPCKCTIHLMCQLIREDTSTQHRLNSNARNFDSWHSNYVRLCELEVRCNVGGHVNSSRKRFGTGKWISKGRSTPQGLRKDPGTLSKVLPPIVRNPWSTNCTQKECDISTCTTFLTTIDNRCVVVTHGAILGQHTCHFASVHCRLCGDEWHWVTCVMGTQWQVPSCCEKPAKQSAATGNWGSFCFPGSDWQPGATFHHISPTHQA